MQPDKLQELTDRLNHLIRQHKENRDEIVAIRDALRALQAGSAQSSISPRSPEVKKTPNKQREEHTQVSIPQQETSNSPVQEYDAVLSKTTSTSTAPKRNLEAFVGGNLIAKLGIVILVLGLGYLVKYAVDNSLLGPAMRVAMGFLSGVVLVGLAYWLKEKYRTYSGILLSGGLSILYFAAYSAYDFYDLIPSSMAFGLMLIFTLFGVFMAYLYDVEAIGIFGLVGAYAVPPLLSDGTGQIQTMFIYMLIINLGVLALAFRKDWKWMNLSAFAFTWLIYTSWYVDSYYASDHFWTALGFGGAFFLLFYATLLAYKVWKNTPFSRWDVSLLLINAFLFYGIGYAVVNEGLPAVEGGSPIDLERFLGLFTLINAVLHFAVAALLYKKNLADKSLFFLVAGLVLAFLTIAIPVQLDGNWVTFLWIGEACLLAWIGQREGAGFYQKLAIPLAILAVFSWAHDMTTNYATSQYDTGEMPLIPIVNIQFLTTVLVSGGLAALMYLQNRKKTENPETPPVSKWIRLGTVLLPIGILVTSFFGGLGEISHYFYQWMSESAVEVDSIPTFREDLGHFREQWMMYFALAYTAILSFLHGRFWQEERGIGLLTLGAGLLAVIVFLASGLPQLAYMRLSYVTDGSEIFSLSPWMLHLRYIGYVFLGACLFFLYRSASSLLDEPKLSNWIQLALHTVILIVLSSELVHLATMGQTDSVQYWEQVDKAERIGLSILWGVYGLLLMSLGFWKKNASLRIGAIVLLGLTLLKVFVFDMSGSTVGSKVVVFVSLGVLLLIVAFLYQRFRHLFEEETTEERLVLSDQRESKEQTGEEKEEKSD